MKFSPIVMTYVPHILRVAIHPLESTPRCNLASFDNVHCTYPILEILTGLLVNTVHVATFHSTTHQRSVCVFYDDIRRLGRLLLLPFDPRLPAFQRFVMPISSESIGDDLTTANHQVIANNDSDVVDLQPLTGVDTTNFLNRFRRNDPQAPVVAEVPLFLVRFTDFNIVG